MLLESHQLDLEKWTCVNCNDITSSGRTKTDIREILHKANSSEASVISNISDAGSLHLRRWEPETVKGNSSGTFGDICRSDRTGYYQPSDSLLCLSIVLKPQTWICSSSLVVHLPRECLHSSTGNDGDITKIKNKQEHSSSNSTWTAFIWWSQIKACLLRAG